MYFDIDRSHHGFVDHGDEQAAGRVLDGRHVAEDQSAADRRRGRPELGQEQRPGEPGGQVVFAQGHRYRDAGPAGAAPDQSARPGDRRRRPRARRQGLGDVSAQTGSGVPRLRQGEKGNRGPDGTVGRRQEERHRQGDRAERVHQTVVQPELRRPAGTDQGAGGRAAHRHRAEDPVAGAVVHREPQLDHTGRGHGQHRPGHQREPAPGQVRGPGRRPDDRGGDENRHHGRGDGRERAAVRPGDPGQTGHLRRDKPLPEGHQRAEDHRLFDGQREQVLPGPLSGHSGPARHQRPGQKAAVSADTADQEFDAQPEETDLRHERRGRCQSQAVQRVHQQLRPVAAGTDHADRVRLQGFSGRARQQQGTDHPQRRRQNRATLQVRVQQRDQPDRSALRAVERRDHQRHKKRVGHEHGRVHATASVRTLGQNTTAANGRPVVELRERHTRGVDS